MLTRVRAFMVPAGTGWVSTTAAMVISLAAVGLGLAFGVMGLVATVGVTLLALVVVAAVTGSRRPRVVGRIAQPADPLDE